MRSRFLPNRPVENQVTVRGERISHSPLMLGETKMGRPKKQKKKIVVPPIPFIQFEDLFKPVNNLTTTVDSVRTYRGCVFVKHIRLPGYHIDPFNWVFPVIKIDVKENTIKIWNRYGPKTKIYDDDLEDEVDQNREYHYEYRYDKVKPVYSIKGWLSGLPSPDEM